MRATVVYESLFGRTQEVAEAVAEGLLAAAPVAAVDCTPVADAGPAAGEVDLLVVGGPTHFLGMSSPRSRRIVRQYQERAAGHRARQAPGEHPAGPGVREWLAALPQAAGGRRAAAFDTRLTTLFPGSAARLIARSLEEHGYEVIARPEGFLVENMLGPLSAGERDRARAWGSALAGFLRPARQASAQGSDNPRRGRDVLSGRAHDRGFGHRHGSGLPPLTRRLPPGALHLVSQGRARRKIEE